MTQVWHHGLVARWWAEFNHGGEDIDRFRGLVGEPALDLGCGTGRLLIPFLESGMDVDGADASPDMIAYARQAIEARGLSASLYVQAMHELEIDRHYASIFMCGAFAIGCTREEQLEGMRRVHDHLAVGGSFVFDHYLPVSTKREWLSWIERPALPQQWPEEEEPRILADGSGLQLTARMTAFDPLAQTFTQEIRMSHYDGDRLLDQETHTMQFCMFFRNEVELMLRHAGFDSIRVTEADSDAEPQPWQSTHLMFTATRA
jgi:SAM-dependent methyltransferase